MSFSGVVKVISDQVIRVRKCRVFADCHFTPNIPTSHQFLVLLHSHDCYLKPNSNDCQISYGHDLTRHTLLRPVQVTFHLHYLMINLCRRRAHLSERDMSKQRSLHQPVFFHSTKWVEREVSRGQRKPKSKRTKNSSSCSPGSNPGFAARDKR